jgi:hypothetical protein
MCADFNCTSTMPGFFCDPTTCDCVPTGPTPTATPTPPPPPTTTPTVTPTPVVVVDHLKCYKVKETSDTKVNLKGIVDLNSPQFGLEPGCKIKRATKFCVPVTKTVDLTQTTINKQPVTLMPVTGQALVDDYICYKIKCEKVDLTANVKDQFATRTFVKFNAKELCVPARKVP